MRSGVPHTLALEIPGMLKTCWWSCMADNDCIGSILSSISIAVLLKLTSTSSFSKVSLLKTKSYKCLLSVLANSTIPWLSPMFLVLLCWWDVPIYRLLSSWVNVEFPSESISSMTVYNLTTLLP